MDHQEYEESIKRVPEFDIKNDIREDDWDEESGRSTGADATKAAIAEVQPGPLDSPIDEATGEPSSEAGLEAASAEDIAATEAEPAAETAENNAPIPIDGNAVVLKIRRRKFKPMNFAKGEMVVTRRLFRTDESEYLLNGKLCRLRDIRDIFMGTGLGPESYAIIEQGRIGQILSSKPYDRRAII